MAKSIPKVTGMEAIVSRFLYEPMAPDEFDSEMFAKRLGISVNSARGRLNRLEDIGELSSRTVLKGGRHTKVYKCLAPGS
jgi:predicted ArsR family transcriptional regulator